MGAHSSGAGCAVCGGLSELERRRCRAWYELRCERWSPELLVCACRLLSRDGTRGSTSAPEGFRLLGLAMFVGGVSWLDDVLPLGWYMPRRPSDCDVEAYDVPDSGRMGDISRASSRGCCGNRRFGVLTTCSTA
jgi:hypothetical protein